MNADASKTTTQTATVADPGATTAPKQATSTRKVSQKKAAPKATGARKTAAPKAAKPASKKASKPATKKASTGSVPREFSKKAIVLDLLRRKDGATMGEIAKATGWANHSIRGFISGTVSKRMGLQIQSTKDDQGERRYKIVAK